MMLIGLDCRLYLESPWGCIFPWPSPLLLDVDGRLGKVQDERPVLRGGDWASRRVDPNVNDVAEKKTCCVNNREGVSKSTLSLRTLKTLQQMFCELEFLTM